eukprot:4434161-Pleurochrysis_carterae.AAC.3
MACYGRSPRLVRVRSCVCAHARLRVCAAAPELAQLRRCRSYCAPTRATLERALARVHPSHSSARAEGTVESVGVHKVRSKASRRKIRGWMKMERLQI